MEEKVVEFEFEFGAKLRSQDWGGENFELLNST